LVWYPKGVEKSEAPSITAYVIIFKSTPALSAAPMAIGNMRAAAALFVTKELIKAVAKYTAPSIPVSVIPKNKTAGGGRQVSPKNI
jgi:hypothetical protein